MLEKRFGHSLMRDKCVLAISVHFKTKPKIAHFKHNNTGHTLNLPKEKAWRHSTCRQQTTECRRKSCSSCKIYEDGWFLFAQFQSQAHLVLDQTPVNSEKCELQPVVLITFINTKSVV